MNTVEKEDKQVPVNQADPLQQLLRDEPGLLPMIRVSFSGGLKPLMVLAYVLAMLFGLALLYCGYQFFTVPRDEQSYWGVLLLLALQAQIGTKLWIWQEMHRTSTRREIKRLELVITQLVAVKVS